jgi:hypothetical protein
MNDNPEILVRDPTLGRILRDAMAAMARASGAEAELAIVKFAAGELERRGDDGSDPISDLSDHAIQVRGLDPDAVQIEIARGVGPVLDERALRQDTTRTTGHKANGNGYANGHAGNGHSGAVGQGPNGVQLKPEQKPVAAKPWSERLLKAKVLKTKTFEPLRYILPEIVPEGATLLVSRPKLGKSWLVLDLAIATAAGRFTLGSLKPSPGAVLYLALEDSERRLQRRMDKLLIGEWPEQLEFATEWRRADQGGLADIEEWIKAHPDARLVIIDTLAHFRPQASGKSQSGYLDDYAALAPLQNLAGKYGVAIIVVHHDRKMEAEDVFDTISGTLGLSGAVDTMLVMKRQSGNVTLHVRGRDIEEAEKAIQFSKDTCRWTIVGEAAEVRRSDERGSILTVLIDATEPMKPGDLSIACGMPRNNIDQLLFKMGKDGEVVKTGRGLYVHPSRSDLLIDLTDLTEGANRKKHRPGSYSPTSDKIDKKVRNEAHEPRHDHSDGDSNVIYLHGDNDIGALVTAVTGGEHDEQGE